MVSRGMVWTGFSLREVTSRKEGGRTVGARFSFAGCGWGWLWLVGTGTGVVYGGVDGRVSAHGYGDWYGCLTTDYRSHLGELMGEDAGSHCQSQRRSTLSLSRRTGWLHHVDLLFGPEIFFAGSTAEPLRGYPEV